MKYVNAADHNAALIAWLVRRYAIGGISHREYIAHVDRLDGHREPYGKSESGEDMCHMRLLTPARALVWHAEYRAAVAQAVVS